jgi:Spy/CpxP family protein refolding chaperone
MEADMKFVIAAAASIILTGSAIAQQPYAALQSRSIKTLSDQEIADLNAGRGMGLALAAELNGYPGPIHTIELANQLHLSPEQITKLKALFESMRAETIPLGTTLISQERDLNNDFANRTITLENLEKTTQGIGATQAALRAAHLKYHLSTVAILTPEQVAQYNELRGYRTEDGSTQGRHQMHQ